MSSHNLGCFYCLGQFHLLPWWGLIATVNYELLPEVIENASKSHPEDECQHQANARKNDSSDRHAPAFGVQANAPSTIPTTLMRPPHTKTAEPHNDRIPSTSEAIARPLLSPAAAGTGMGAGATAGGGTGGSCSAISSPLQCYYWIR
jgi:hypothetical protein